MMHQRNREETSFTRSDLVFLQYIIVGIEFYMRLEISIREQSQSILNLFIFFIGKKFIKKNLSKGTSSWRERGGDSNQGLILNRSERRSCRNGGRRRQVR